MGTAYYVSVRNAKGGVRTAILPPAAALIYEFRAGPLRLPVEFVWNDWKVRLFANALLQPHQRRPAFSAQNIVTDPGLVRRFDIKE